MSHADALDALDRAGHLHIAHFRRLCADANPDRPQRDAVRVLVVRLATDGTPPIRADYGEPGPGPCGGCP